MLFPAFPQLPRTFAAPIKRALPRQRGFAGLVESQLRLPRPIPSTTQVKQIAALPDPIQRNLQITLTYHDLTHALAVLLGKQNVSWCAYATWASKTAGAFIRGERSSLPVQQYLEQTPYVQQGLAQLNRVLAWFNQSISLRPVLLANLINQITDEIASHVGHGNLIVFAEMAPCFTRFLETFAGSLSYNQADLTRFLSRYFIPGPVAEGGQDMLITAFTYYYEAMFARNPKLRAELILLANLYVGYHEQTRLQGAITGAMEAPLELKLETAIIEGIQRWLYTSLPRQIARLIWSIWQTPLQSLAHRLAADWRAMMTRYFMTIKLPTETLRLGQDVPRLQTGAMFPSDLRRLHHPALQQLLAELDKTPDSSYGSGAADWGCLRDRMNFVADFFRSRQQERRLYRQPFYDDQVVIICQGGIPTGRL